MEKFFIYQLRRYYFEVSPVRTGIYCRMMTQRDRLTASAILPAHGARCQQRILGQS
jgi:hypothetical protein